VNTLHRIARFFRRLFAMSIGRRFAKRDTLSIRVTVQHNGDVSIESLENWITSQICGFRQNDENDPWVLTGPTFTVLESNDDVSLKDLGR